MSGRLSHIGALVSAAGVLSAVKILACRAMRLKAEIEVDYGGKKLIVRPSDSDLFVLGQIFGKHEYDLGDYKSKMDGFCKSWAQEGVQPVILDIGANVGYSSIYFAEQFPDAIVIAVEADADTFRMLSRNVNGHPRIRPLHAAVWNHERGVSFDGASECGSWAGRVGSEEGLTPSVYLRNTYSDIPDGRPLILKLDVEGAEKEIAEEAGDILHSVPCILVEPHDFMLPGAGVLTPMYRALSDRRIDTIIRDEVLMFFDVKLSAERNAS